LDSDEWRDAETCYYKSQAVLRLCQRTVEAKFDDPENLSPISIDTKNYGLR